MIRKAFSLLIALAGLVSCQRFTEAEADRAGSPEGFYGMGMMDGGLSGLGGGNGQGHPGGQAGVLTAGEWNDLDHWDFWSGLMTSDTYGTMPEFWRMFTPRRVAVRVEDAAGKRLPAVRIDLEQDGKAVWSTLTDNVGEASLWIDPFHAEAGTDGLTLVVNGVRQAASPKVTPWNVQQKEADVNVCQAKGAREPDGKADIAFIVDATGSMGDEIAFLKKDLVNILERVRQNQGGVELRTGTVFYRDEGDAYVTKFSPFTTDVSETTRYISQQYAEGGGDLPEAVHTALEAGLQNLAWNASARSRIAFLVLDAPAHQDQQGVVESLQASLRRYAEAGVKLIPVFCSSPSKECEFMCRSFAILTGGTYVFLTDDSGVGGEHVEPSVGEFEVELLNDLLVRLIGKYIG